MAVDWEVTCDTLSDIESCHLDGSVDSFLRHPPVGSPLSTGNREQPGRRNLNGMVARQPGSRLGVSRLHQGANASKNAENVRSGWPFDQISTSRFEDEIDLLRERSWFQSGFWDGCVRCP